VRRHRVVVGAIPAGTALAAAAMAVAVAVVGSGRFLEIALGLGRDAQTPALYTLESRIEIWSRAVSAIRDFAFTGMGMNTFRLLVHRLYPLYTVALGRDIAHAHNLWLQAALDLGVPGLVAYAALWLGAAVMLAGIWRAASESEAAGPAAKTDGGAAGRGLADLWPASFGHAIAAGLGGGLLSHFVYGLTDAVTLGAKPGVVWWLMLGLIAGLFLQMQAMRVK
jgi:O-antigen ligase